ncbi:MAG: hypothetical protein AMJ45_00840 [Syntrophobacter sp. DG_60]|nr:MAG: hypothetical protein AMJ45_00840 [Syntrophobacter sp. DG_60]
MKSKNWLIQLPRDKIAFFQWVIEAHDGLAQFRTVDPYKAIIKLMVPPGSESDLEELISHLAKEMGFEISFIHKK